MDLTLLERTLAELRQPAYRARQVTAWAFSGAGAFDEMTDLPSRLRTQLSAAVPYSTLAVKKESRARDGTIKVLFSTADGRPVEAVLMRYRDGRRSVCLSSQSGCPLTCTFCATGQMRFGRNLSASEILDQVLWFKRGEVAEGRSGPDHAVFMGMGEPLLNLDSVLEACRYLPELGIGHRRTAISTVGWIPGIRRLTAAPMPVRLALSLHAADDALRSQLMPVNQRYPIAEVLEACRDYYRRKRRRVFVEYVMLAGVNDAHGQAVALADALDPRTFKVNLIPYNPTSSRYDGSSPKAIAAFRAELERRGLGVTVRLERGREIDAACGQLAASLPRRTTSSQNTNREVAGLAVSAAHSPSSNG
jgi:23S rRNA (adenine2503-C2)-methyltransferase